MATRPGGGADTPDCDDRAVTTSDLWTVLAGIVLGIVVLGGILYFGGAGPLAPLAGDQSAANPSDERAPELNTTLAEQQITEAVNDERTARGIEPVEHEDAIALVARNHSRDMIEREYYAHESPEGETAFERIEEGAASCGTVGENIAATWWYEPFETTDGERDRHTTVEELADGLAEQWLNSQSHRENMLDPRWERTGVGVAVTDDGEVLVTQNFCA